jgi:glycosyltransferase involved in cell wall biosynthesis
MKPLVSCILVTRDRPTFLRQALRCYAAQDYPNKELIVVDDGASSAEPLCAGVRGLTYLRLRGRTPTGSKLNLGIQASRGSIVQKLDDDDFYGPAFLSTAAARLVRARRADALVTWCCFVVLITGDPVLYFSGHRWMTGGTLCFHRALWQRHRFRDIYRTSDGWFIRDAEPFVARVCDPEQYIVVRHGGNTWRRIEGQESVEGYFRSRPYHKSVRQIVGRRNAAFYESLMTRPLTAP